MIPTGYTEESFSEWLTQKVFFEDTEGLGLADIRGEAPASYKELVLEGTAEGNYTSGYTGGVDLYGPIEAPWVPIIPSPRLSYPDYVLDIKPSPFVFEEGDIITFENGIKVEVRVGTSYGGTTLGVNILEVPEGTNIYNGLRLRQQTGDAVTRIPNPVFSAILGQVLLQMDLLDVSEIDLDNMYEFRQRGVLETLKVVMQNLASLYPLLDPATGGDIYAGTLHNQLLNLYRVEEANLNAYIAFKATQERAGFNMVDEGLSSETNVKVVW